MQPQMDSRVGTRLRGVFPLEHKFISFTILTTPSRLKIPCGGCSVCDARADTDGQKILGICEKREKIS